MAEFQHVARGGNGRITCRGRAQILEANAHAIVSDLSGWLVDGQVEWDVTGDADKGPSRTATCNVLDPDGRAGLDPGGWAGEGGTFRIDRFLRLRRDYWLPTHETWASVPLFTGPISGVSRSGDTITINGEGKEALALGPLWTGMQWSKATRKVQVIEDLMREGAGEHFFHMPPGWSQVVGKAKTVPRVLDDWQFTPWQQSLWMAKSLGAQLFYDGRGILRLRRRPVTPLWTFTDHEVAAQPEVSERTRDVVNTVVVEGGIAKGATKPVYVSRSLPDSHPWSPQSLGRNGVPRRVVEVIADDQITTTAAAVATAERRLRELETTAVDLTMEALPMPTLEPDDLYAVTTETVTARARAKKATISVVGDLMSLGAVKVYRPTRARGRR